MPDASWCSQSRFHSRRRKDPRLQQSLVRKGIETATKHQLSQDLSIQVLTPALFLATKLEAFAGRGTARLERN
jgi:hypothetical protein